MYYYTKEDDKQIEEMYRKGKSIRYISVILGRTVPSVKERMKLLRKRGIEIKRWWK